MRQKLGSPPYEPAGLHYLTLELLGSCVPRKEPAGLYDLKMHGSYVPRMEADECFDSRQKLGGSSPYSRQEPRGRYVLKKEPGGAYELRLHGNYLRRMEADGSYHLEQEPSDSGVSRKEAGEKYVLRQDPRRRCVLRKERRAYDLTLHGNYLLRMEVVERYHLKQEGCVQRKEAGKRYNSRQQPGGSFPLELADPPYSRKEPWGKCVLRKVREPGGDYDLRPELHVGYVPRVEAGESHDLKQKPRDS